MDIVDEIVDDMLCKVESEFKHCNKCDLTKLKSEFSKDKKAKTGLNINVRAALRNTDKITKKQ